MDDIKYSISRMDVDTSTLKVLEEYAVGKVKVYITKNGQYMIKEPHVAEDGREIYNKIMSKINMGVGLNDEDVDPETMAAKLEDEFWKTAAHLKLMDEVKKMFPDLRYYIHREILGYGILDPLMRDTDIEDILCSSFGRNIHIIHKRYSGRFHTLKTNVRFENSRDMERFIQKIYGATGTEPTESKPMSVTYMADGSRISATFGKQVSMPGPVIAIRKFPANPFTITHMMETGTLTTEMAAYIWTMLDAKAVGLVIGVTGSGKTTLLASFISMMNPNWRILSIEDTPELQIPHEDWVRLKTRKSYGMLSDQYDITIRNLIDVSLTQKPDYEIVGEIRLNDMDALFQSVGTGHGGLTSFHASSPGGALTRMRGNKISDGELALLWFTVYSSVVKRDGKNYRKIMNISEIVGNEETGKISVEDIFKYDVFADKFNKTGELKTHKRYLEAITVCGIKDPEADMQKRMKLLKECIDTKAEKVNEVFNILSKYYE